MELQYMFEGRPVTLLHSEEKGRYLVCNRDIQPGESIFQQDPPYSAVVTSAYKNSVCNTCLSYIKEINRHNMKCCAGCNEVYFCSDECKASRRMDSFHSQIECVSLANFTHHLRSGYDQDEIMTIRMVIRIMCRKILETDNNSEQFDIIMSLSDHSHEYEEQVKELITRMVSTIKLIEEPPGIFSEPQGQLFSLISKVKGNFFGIWSRNGKETIWCGASIYLRCSFFNHSCFPNCTVIQDTNTKDSLHIYPSGGASFTVRSLCSIPKGTELCISYIPLENDTTSRRKHLQTNWLFLCNCPRCLDPLSDAKSISPYCCAVPRCTGGLLIPDKDGVVDVDERGDDNNIGKSDGEHPSHIKDSSTGYDSSNCMVGVCRVCFTPAYVPLERDIFK